MLHTFKTIKRILIKNIFHQDIRLLLKVKFVQNSLRRTNVNELNLRQLNPKCAYDRQASVQTIVLNSSVGQYYHRGFLYDFRYISIILDFNTSY